MCVYLECVGGFKKDELDSFHDAWIELHSKYGGNLHPGALRNRTKQRTRDAHRRSNRIESFSPQENVLEGHPELQPQNQFLKKERTQILQECIDALPAINARILRADLEEKTTGEIASDLGLSAKTVYRRRSNAEKALAAQPRLRKYVQG